MREKLRSLASDTAVYGASTIIQRFLTFLLTPLYTNYLTMSELGVVSNVYALIAFVNILYAFGFESAFMRFYRGDNNEKALVFTQSFVPVVGIAACMSGILYVLRAHTAPFAGIGPDAPSSLFALVLLIPFLDAVSIIPFAQLRMERKARRFATYKVLSVVVNIALNVILVVGMALGSRGVFIAGACSSLVSVILVAPHIARGLRRGASRLRELAAFGIPTIPSGFASMLLQVADRPILTAMTTPLIVGLYNANYRLAIPMMLCVSVFEYAWKPFYLQHAEDDDAPVLFGRIFTYFTLMSALVFLLISLFASVVVQLPFPGGAYCSHRGCGLLLCGHDLEPLRGFAHHKKNRTLAAGGWFCRRREHSVECAAYSHTLVHRSRMGHLWRIRCFGVHHAAELAEGIQRAV
jgi:O-antigen/teichoic acid export membrane protein